MALYVCLIERGDDSENDSYMSLTAEKQSLQNNSLNNNKKERKKTTTRVFIAELHPRAKRASVGGAP